MEHPFWSISAEALIAHLQASAQGLTSAEAAQRLVRYGANRLKPKQGTGTAGLLLAQFKSPIILILLFAAALSYFLHDPVDSVIILAIVLVSGLLGFWQERGAAHAVESLLAMVQIKSAVQRDGKGMEIPVEEVVPGDVIVLHAGDVIPADSLILESKDLFVDEAALTGETFPVEKTVGILGAETALAQRTNALWMGTHVVSGSARAVAVRTGTATEFGSVSERLKLKPQETEFEHGIRRFGYLLMEVTLMLVIAIFAFNVFLARPVLEALLFSLALAVGLTPQLLPAIISINLAHGAKNMAREKVIVKRLASIENFGSMDVLCSDKTGTLTEGKVRLHAAVAVDGAESDKVRFHAYLNSLYETGFANPIDSAIRAGQSYDTTGYTKIDEVPYDFIRKRLSILVSAGEGCLLIAKGALMNILEVCTAAEMPAGGTVPIATVREQVDRQLEAFSRQGYRTLGVAYKNVCLGAPLTKQDEAEMTLLGFLVFFDPLKPDIIETVADLQALGVGLKVITGDNHLVAAELGRQMGLADARILTGPELRHMSEEALISQVSGVNIFAEVEPNQKERLIVSLRKAGHVVGYMGDGINDASALHAADVSISVDQAVDVAKEAADFVLLEQDLKVLERGVREGRRTFANTLKYVFMATSANFGNMFSMAGASLLLPFLPLLPKQILLTNLLTDLPEMTIARDSVDAEMVARPRRWDIAFIRNFMLTFGILSSVFDYLTFAVLLFIMHADPIQFRTGWFIESVISACLIVLVVRSRRPFIRSRPGRYLILATSLVIGATICLPFSPLAGLFNFQRLPLFFYAALGLIVALYIVSAEIAKQIFFRREKS